MDKTYKVLQDTCGKFKQGDTAKGSDLSPHDAGLEYLLRVGAIVEVKPAKVTDAAVTGNAGA